MPLLDNTLFGQVDKVAVAIERLRTFVPKEGCWVGVSGGKDSTVVYDLVKKSGVNARFFYAMTTIDPPQVVWHIRKYMPDVHLLRPQKPLLQKMLDKNCIPLRRTPWCCALYKEAWGKDRFVVTGVRAAESPRRSNHKMMHRCFKTKRDTLNVILDWSDSDVWDYIEQNGLPVNELYKEPYNFDRIGCVLCPKVRDIPRQKQFFPRIYEAWHRAVLRLYEKGVADGRKLYFKSGEELWQWWLNRDSAPIVPEQCELFGAGNE